MMEDKSTVTMDARTGFFDSKQQMLDLRKDIFLQSSTGYEAKLSQAYIDINKGTVTSDEHVDVKLLNGTLTADRLKIINSGEIVRFEGNVVMNLIMESPAAPEPEPEPAPQKTRSGTGKQSTRNEIHDAVLLAPFCGRGVCARVARLAATPWRKAPCPACRTRCRAFRRTATSRFRSRRPRSKCATRKRKRPSPAT